MLNILNFGVKLVQAFEASGQLRPHGVNGFVEALAHELLYSVIKMSITEQAVSEKRFLPPEKCLLLPDLLRRLVTPSLFV